VTTWTLDRLAKDWVGPLTVTASDGSPVVDWTYAILPHRSRPVDTDAISGAADATADGLGIYVGPGTGNELTPGTYLIWVRWVAGGKAPVTPPDDPAGVLVIL